MASAARCKCLDRLGNALVCGAGTMQGAAKRGAQRGAGVLSGMFKGAGARGTGRGAPHPRLQGQAAEDHHAQEVERPPLSSKQKHLRERKWGGLKAVMVGANAVQ